MRQIFILNVLSVASIFVLGFVGLGLWWLVAVYSVFLMAAMVWRLARLPEPEWGAMATLAFTLLVCAVAVATDANLFAANDPRPGRHQGQSSLWLGLLMFGLLCFVWAIRIWMDFTGWLGRSRAGLAAGCAVLFLLLSSNGSQIDEGRRSYSVASASYHQAGGKQTGSDLNSVSYRQQGLRQNQEALMVLLLISGGLLGVASCFDRPKPLPADPPLTYEI